MPVEDLELISADEKEKLTLQKMNEILSSATASAKSANTPFPKFVGPNGETFEIPASVLRLLQQAIGYMSHGRVLTVTPHSQSLCLSDAAEFLKIPQSSLVKLLENGELPFTEVGTQRFIQFSDLLAYKRHIKQERSRALAEMAEFSQEIGNY